MYGLYAGAGLGKDHYKSGSRKETSANQLNVSLNVHPSFGHSGLLKATLTTDGHGSRKLALTMARIHSAHPIRILRMQCSNLTCAMERRKTWR